MADRPYLTTRECAGVIGQSSRYVRDEILDGRLTAEVIPRDVSLGRQYAQRLYRVYPEDFAAYLKRYWPRVAWNKDRHTAA